MSSFVVLCLGHIKSMMSKPVAVLESIWPPVFALKELVCFVSASVSISWRGVMPHDWFVPQMGMHVFPVCWSGALTSGVFMLLGNVPSYDPYNGVCLWC